MFKCRSACNAVFNGQPRGRVSVLHIFYFAGLSHAALYHPNHSSRLELRENGHQWGHE